MRDNDETAEFELDEPVGAETDKAILIVVEGDKYWVPKSQIHANSEVYAKGHEGTIIVSEWWAKKEKLL